VVENAPPGRVTLKKKQLFNDPAIDHRTMELSALKTLATALKVA